VEEQKRPGRWVFLLIVLVIGVALVLFEMFLNWLLPGTRI